MLPECTFFTHSHPNMIDDFLFELKEDFPELVKDRALFLKKMEESYDAFTRGQWVSKLGHPAVQTMKSSQCVSNKSGVK